MQPLDEEKENPCHKINRNLRRAVSSVVTDPALMQVVFSYLVKRSVLGGIKSSVGNELSIVELLDVTKENSRSTNVSVLSFPATSQRNQVRLLGDASRHDEGDAARLIKLWQAVTLQQSGRMLIGCHLVSRWRIRRPQSHTMLREAVAAEVP